MTGVIATIPRNQFFDALGKPLAGGKLYTYSAGTTTPVATFQDQALTIKNENPIPLDATGSCTIWLDPAKSYKFVLKDKKGITQPGWPVDNVAGASTPVSLAPVLAGYARLDSLSAVDGAGLIGFKQDGLGAVARTVQDRLLDAVSAFDFMTPQQIKAVRAGTVFDVTAALQKAINALSQTQARTLVLPAGTYRYTKLYCHYDAALNPGYNIDRDGEITLSGDGISSENGGSCGTILLCTGTTDDGLIVSPPAEDALPYRSRDFMAAGISFQGNTSGALVLARGVPGARFFGCEFIQNHAAGTGLWITTSYFGVVEKCRFQNRASGTKTGDAIKFGTTIAAGLFTLRDCNVSGYANGLNMYAGDWQQLSVVDSEISGSVYGIYANGNIQVLNCARTYFEGACTSFIADSGSNRIKNLVMTGCWSYGAGLTGPAIDLAAPNSVQISGGYSQDQNTAYLNIQDLPSGGTGGYMVQGISFPRTVAAPAPVTLFTGMLPEFHGVDYATGDVNVKLYGPAKYPIVSLTNFLGDSSYQAAGHQLRTSMKDFGPVAGGSIDLQGSGFPAVVFAYCTGSTTTIYLPSKGSGIPHGFNHVITNDAASTQPLTIMSAIADGSAVVGTVAPGVQRTFFFFNEGTPGWK